MEGSSQAAAASFSVMPPGGTDIEGALDKCGRWVGELLSQWRAWVWVVEGPSQSCRKESPTLRVHWTSVDAGWGSFSLNGGLGLRRLICPSLITRIRFCLMSDNMSLKYLI